MLYTQNGDRIVTMDSVTALHPILYAQAAAEAIQTACVVQQSVTSQTNDDAVISPHRVRERVTCDGMCWKVDWLGEERRNSTAPCGPCVVAVRTGRIRRRWRRAVVVSISYHIISYQKFIVRPLRREPRP